MDLHPHSASPRLFAPGVLYHVIVRGNPGQRTFTAESDYQAYIERLARYRKKYDYVLHAYCLMPNHVHLLVESSEQPLGGSTGSGITKITIFRFMPLSEPKRSFVAS